MANHNTNPNAWSRYVPKDEPPEVLEVWDAAAAALKRARVAEEERYDEKARDHHLRSVYACFRKLRELGLNCGTGWNARHGIPTSKLLLFGERPHRWKKKQA